MILWASYYTHSSKRLADGTRFNRYAYFAAAPNRYKLGERRTLISLGSGRRVTVIFRDRESKKHQNRFDLSPVAARKLMGPRYKTIGIVKVRIL